MSERHPDPCAARCETADALRAVESFMAGARNEAERILAGAHGGCCDIHQALWATDLRNEMLSIAGLLGAVEPATVHALSHPAPMMGEAA